MTTMTTQNSGARSVASVKMGNPSLVFGRCFTCVGADGECAWAFKVPQCSARRSHRPTHRSARGTESPPVILARSALNTKMKSCQEPLKLHYCPLHKELKISKSGRDVSPARNTCFSRGGPPCLPFVSQRLLDLYATGSKWEKAPDNFVFLQRHSVVPV
jgi:hypothetical protein